MVQNRRTTVRAYNKDTEQIEPAEHSSANSGNVKLPRNAWPACTNSGWGQKNGRAYKEFLKEFSRSLTDMNYGLVDFNEKEPILCTEELISFQKLVTVEFEIFCSLIDDDTPILEQALVDTYNALSTEYYCDPYF